jgi:hypothetical protein
MPDTIASPAGDRPQPPWYFKWVDEYQKAFGLRNEQLVEAMLEHWWPAFELFGYERTDFEQAMPRIIGATVTPNWTREHLALVKEKLNEVRTQRLGHAREETYKPEGQPCYTCDWIGAVRVPLPLDVRNGVWIPPFRTCAVACDRCGPGRRAYDYAVQWADKNSKPRWQLIGKYEQTVLPDWKSWMAQLSEARRLTIQAETRTPMGPLPIEKTRAVVAVITADIFKDKSVDLSAMTDMPERTEDGNIEFPYPETST